MINFHFSLPKNELFLPHQGLLEYRWYGSGLSFCTCMVSKQHNTHTPQHTSPNVPQTAAQRVTAFLFLFYTKLNGLFEQHCNNPTPFKLLLPSLGQS